MGVRPSLNAALGYTPFDRTPTLGDQGLDGWATRTAPMRGVWSESGPVPPPVLGEARRKEEYPGAGARWRSAEAREHTGCQGKPWLDREVPASRGRLEGGVVGGNRETGETHAARIARVSTWGEAPSPLQGSP